MTVRATAPPPTLTAVAAAAAIPLAAGIKSQRDAAPPILDSVDVSPAEVSAQEQSTTKLLVSTAQTASVHVSTPLLPPALTTPTPTCGSFAPAHTHPVNPAVSSPAAHQAQSAPAPL